MRKLLGCILMVSAGQACAASAPVEELSSGRQNTSTAYAYPAETPAPKTQINGAGDLYYQLQVLQEEVRELRGIVEEQSNELRLLRQQQLDDYQDLDRRLSGGAAPSASQNLPQSSSSQSDQLAPPSTAPSSPTAQPAAADTEAEQQSYDAAYELLKNRDVDQALNSFKAHVSRYPQGKYTANAYYWLGEIYLLQNNLPEANTAFTAVVERFPAHRKSTDAMFKLGKVLHMQGQTAKAKELLQQVAGTNSSAANLARSYLQENF